MGVDRKQLMRPTRESQRPLIPAQDDIHSLQHRQARFDQQQIKQWWEEVNLKRKQGPKHCCQDHA